MPTEKNNDHNGSGGQKEMSDTIWVKMFRVLDNSQRVRSASIGALSIQSSLNELADLQGRKTGREDDG